MREQDHGWESQPPLPSLGAVSSLSCSWLSMASLTVAKTHSSSRGTVGTRQQAGALPEAQLMQRFVSRILTCSLRRPPTGLGV